jgi:hypothetical protein
MQTRIKQPAEASSRAGNTSMHNATNAADREARASGER